MVLTVRASTGGQGLVVMCLVGMLTLMVTVSALDLSEARDLLLQKEQEVTQFGEIHVEPFDQKNWNRHQGMFKWVAMACGWKVPEDLQGREGWYGAPRITPLEPGVSVFPPDQPTVYVVYEISALDAPMQMNADWFKLNKEGMEEGKRLGQDGLFMDMNEAYGYLEVRQPDGGWSPGEYLVKIYISSPGQDIHALNMVGTMRFAINSTEEAIQTGKRCQEAFSAVGVAGY